MQAARAAGLRHVTGSMPGIRRERHGRGFRYTGLGGEPVRDRQTLGRVRSLAIPPAWTEVWICPDARGHVQATGRDAKSRKQYRYHPLWRAVRDDTKYGRMVTFGEALPGLRRQLARDIDREEFSREKVLATVLRLLDVTRIWVGNEEYARDNHSFGLTTLRNEHVAVRGTAICFQFRGKSGKEHHITVRDQRLAHIVKHCSVSMQRMKLACALRYRLLWPIMAHYGPLWPYGRCGAALGALLRAGRRRPADSYR